MNGSYHWQRNTTSHALKLDYADFLGRFPWDFYSTITFRRPRHDGIYMAEKVWRSFDKLGASRGFIAVEPHSLEGIHLHCLTRQYPWEDNVSAATIWKYMFKAYGRSTVEVVDSPLAVARYCSKYVVKGNQYEFKGDKECWLNDSWY